MSFNKSTCDLCDEFEDELKYPTASIFRDFGGLKHFYGKIETVQCLEDNSFVNQVLDEPGDGKILVVDGGGSLKRALLGDMVAAKAISNGWSGLIVNGCIRDSKQVGTMSLGIKALGTTPRKTVKRGNGVRNIPVEFAGIQWSPGDMVVADEDGIVVLAKEKADNLIE
mmetsp:Transcript_3001/g.3815  ORF Transcript_3001/g.3815 Transcript_3001/m.3815 type:complete len:168 (-) Transcript_3001:727-1230(-)